MEKYAVVTEELKNEKLAATCQCGNKIEQKGNISWCPSCGAKESTKDKKN